MKSIAPWLALVLLVRPLHAGSDTLARVDISGKTANPVAFEVEGISGGQEYNHPDSPRTVTFGFEAGSEWQKASVTLRPKESGKMMILFLGPWIRVVPDQRELKPVLIDYDDLKIEGAEEFTGNLESMDSEMNPKGFFRNDVPNSNPPITDDNRGAMITGDAAEGVNYLRVWHNSRYGTMFYVEKDTPVTVSFSYRLNP